MPRVIRDSDDESGSDADPDQITGAKETKQPQAHQAMKGASGSLRLEQNAGTDSAGRSIVICCDFR